MMQARLQLRLYTQSSTCLKFSDVGAAVGSGLNILCNWTRWASGTLSSSLEERLKKDAAQIMFVCVSACVCVCVCV
jgi:hypothetical protein